MNRLQEIEERLAAIGEEIERRGEGLNEDEFTGFNTEVNELREERARLIRANEDRTRLLNEIAEQRTTGAVTRTFTAPGAEGRQQQAEDDPLSSMEYRKAFMAHVLKGAPIPEEFRADAITQTTDIGAMIPTTTLNKIIEKMESVGMILPLVTHTAYKGGLVIPTSSVKPHGSQSRGGKKKKGNVPNAMVGFILEYGTSRHSPRAWMADANERSSGEVNEAMRKVWKGEIDGN